jgi:transcriptional regulator
MYLPKPFELVDDGEIEAFMQRYDFATVVSHGGGTLEATHIPVTLTRVASKLTIVGHVARANPHWTSMDGVNEAVVIFHGPHAYISPTWYETPPPAVPTWNYAVVHAYGRPRANEDPAFIERQIRQLADRHEGGRTLRWRFDDLPADYGTRQLAAIVGFEMPVDRVEAKYKLGQNRAAADRRGAIAGLEKEPSADARAMAAFMRMHTRDA